MILSKFVTALLVLFTLGNMAKASALEITDCKSANVDLTSLIYPVNMKAYYKGSVKIYKIDQIEPAAAPIGLAIVMPGTPNDEIFIENCWAVTGLGDVDLNNTKSKYDSKTGLLLSMPIMQYNPEKGDAEPAGDLKLRIQLNNQVSSIKLEK